MLIIIVLIIIVVILLLWNQRYLQREGERETMGGKGWHLHYHHLLTFLLVLCSVVGTWYLWTTVRPTCVVKSWPHIFFVLETNQSLQNSVSQGASTSHRGVKTDRGHNFNITTIGHSGPHDPWGHQANVSQVPPLFSLFRLFQLIRLNSPRGEVWLLQLTCFCSTSVEERCSFSAHPARGNPPKLYQPSSRPAWSRLLKASKRQWRKSLPKTFSTRAASHSRTTNRSHKPATRLHWTLNSTSISNVCSLLRFIDKNKQLFHLLSTAIMLWKHLKCTSKEKSFDSFERSNSLKNRQRRNDSFKE